MIGVRAATAADYPVLLELNEAAIPAVSRIDADTLASLHRQADTLLVAEQDAEIVGFLLALNPGADYSSPNFQFFRIRYPKFTYVDRIVVAASARSGGIGRRLYEALFSVATCPERITCEVNIRPPNPRSLTFHKRLGFRVVAEQDTEHGEKRVALMVRES